MEECLETYLPKGPTLVGLMGGAARHTGHLYEREELLLDSIFDILKMCSQGKIVATEKIDGMNIVFTWKEGLRFARNKGDIAAGGFQKDFIEKQYSKPGYEKVKAAFTGAFNALQHSLMKLDGEKIRAIFGDERWFSAEIAGPVNPNVVHYDRNAVVVHNTKMDPRDENFSDCLNLLLGSISGECSGWLLRGPAYVKFTPLSKPELKDLENSLRELAKSVLDTKIFSWRHITVLTYTKCRLSTMLEEMGIVSPMAALDTASRIIGTEGHQDLRTLKKNYPQEAQLIHELVNKEWALFRKAQEPLAKLVAEYSSRLFKDMDSCLIADKEIEVARLRKETQVAIEKHKSSDDIKDVMFIEEFEERLGSVENITSPVEGVVFNYGGKPTKLTGSFGDANRILGYKRYVH